MTLGLELPAAGASRGTQLTFVRDLSLRSFLVSSPAIILALLLASGPVVVVVIASLVLQLINIVWLQLKIVRYRAHEGGGQT